MPNKKISFDPEFEEITRDDVVPAELNNPALLLKALSGVEGTQVISVPESGDPEIVIQLLGQAYKIFEASPILRRSTKEIKAATTAADGSFKPATIEGLELTSAKMVENVITEKALVGSLTRDLYSKFTGDADWKEMSKSDKEAIVLSINKIRALLRFKIINLDGSESPAADFRQANNVP